MKIKEIVNLKRTARKNGGDRYESPDKEFVIYIPQYISRPSENDGEPLLVIQITFEG